MATDIQSEGYYTMLNLVVEEQAIATQRAFDCWEEFKHLPDVTVLRKSLTLLLQREVRPLEHVS